MTEEEKEKLEKLIKRKEKANNLPLQEKLKYIKEYAEITAEIMELESKCNNDSDTLEENYLFLADVFIKGLKFSDAEIEEYVLNCFAELEQHTEVSKIMWKLRAIQDICYRLKEAC